MTQGCGAIVCRDVAARSRRIYCDCRGRYGENFLSIVSSDSPFCLDAHFGMVDAGPSPSQISAKASRAFECATIGLNPIVTLVFLFGIGGTLLCLYWLGAKSALSAASNSGKASASNTVEVTSTPVTDDLRLSITSPPQYDDKLGIVTINVVFMNNGTAHRQILGYDFLLQQYEQPQHQPGHQESRVFESHSEDAPLKIPSRDIQAATYKQQIPLSDLIPNMTEYINLKIKFLSEEGIAELRLLIM